MAKPSTDQARRFQQMARELECDESPEAFAKRLNRLAEAPPLDENGPGSKKKPRQAEENCDGGDG